MGVEKMSEIHKAIEAATSFQKLMQGILPTLILGTQSFVEKSGNLNVTATKNESLHILNGALVVYLFNVWDSYFDHSCVNKYFRDDEKLRFYAFKHIRIVAAHNTNGDRKGNRREQDRMDHAEKLDQIMESEFTIEGLAIDQNKIDLSNSNVALDCRQFMQDMAIKLASGRISVGGAHGQIRVTGGGTTDVM